MHDVKRTSYRSQPIQRDGSWGYINRFGGFHGTTDTYAYVGLIVLVLKNLHHPRTVKWLLHLIWARWHHRMCDAMDFHHYACLRSSYGRKLDAQYRWQKAWTGKY